MACVLQESPGQVPAGRLPRTVECVLLDDLIDTTKPGEEVEVTGVCRPCLVSVDASACALGQGVLLFVVRRGYVSSTATGWHLRAVHTHLYTSADTKPPNPNQPQRPPGLICNIFLKGMRAPPLTRQNKLGEAKCATRGGCCPDRSRCAGVYKNNFDPLLNHQHGFPVFATNLEANYVERKTSSQQSHKLTDEDKEKILALSKLPDIGARLIRSIAPSIHGHDTIKLGLLLSLLSGQVRARGQRHSAEAPHAHTRPAD